LRPPSRAGGSPEPSLGLTLFIEAQPQSACPPPRSDRSTKASSPWAAPAPRPGTFAAMSPSSSRSRFFENTEWSQAASSTPIPTNQRNSRSYRRREHFRHNAERSAKHNHLEPPGASLSRRGNYPRCCHLPMTKLMQVNCQRGWNFYRVEPFGWRVLRMRVRPYRERVS